jgi:hypothetical protein
VSKPSAVETVETVEGVEVTQLGFEEMEPATRDQHIGVRIPGGKQSFQVSAARILRSHSFREAEIPTVI